MDIEKFLIDEVTKSPDYVGHPTDRYYYSEKDMVTFAEKYHQAKLKLLGIAFVMERFSPMQKVEWDGMEYWVMEDNGEGKVLVANADETTHPEYNDWWVDRDKLNAL